jgi:hypothetical protein
MDLIFIEKKDRNNNLLDTLLKTWESSVRDTHVFLSENNFGNVFGNPAGVTQSRFKTDIRTVVQFIRQKRQTNQAFTVLPVENIKPPPKSDCIPASHGAARLAIPDIIFRFQAP